jgi:hypothetical protein
VSNRVCIDRCPKLKGSISGKTKSWRKKKRRNNAKNNILCCVVLCERYRSVLHPGFPLNDTSSGCGNSYGSMQQVLFGLRIDKNPL